MERGMDAVPLEESLTWAVKLKVLATVGMPEMTPAVLSVSPPGRFPDTTVQAPPPLEVRVDRKLAAKGTRGSEEVGIANAGTSVMERGLDAVALEESFTWEVKVE